MSLSVACSDDDAATPIDGGLDSEAVPADSTVDAPDARPVRDAGPVPGSTDHCTYEAPLPTARAGGTVTAGTLSAGAAERVLSLPVSSALGAYTARVDFLGDIETPDQRFSELSGTFVPSYGVETRPLAKAIAITAGDETVVVLKADLALADEAITHEVSLRLGEDFGGKVLFATSHSHSAFAQYTANSVLWVGLGRKRTEVTEALIEDLVEVANAALDARQPARIGVAHEPRFDPTDVVTRDRRTENDVLAGGAQKDDDLFVMRIDGLDGAPLAVMSVFGVHGTVLDADNPLASTDAIGAIERAVEESFEEEVVVMHLQGAGGDVSPSGSGGIRCDGQPCYNFARAEMVGRNARDWILTAWMDAADRSVDRAEMEMISQSIVLGPSPATFAVRGGTLSYAPWDGTTEGDGELFDDMGDLLSPIDEFNAPFGAALCGEDNDALFPGAQILGTRGRPGPFRSCMRLEVAAPILGMFFELPFEPMPSCSATRTMLTVWRFGDFLFATVPGEPVTPFADALRAVSPVPPERTVVIGFAQDHVGYVMTAEDWMLRGYEPSINIWGPLEGEYIGERLDALMDLAVTPTREEPPQATRYLPLPVDEGDLPEPDPAPLAGTIETVPWERQYVRGGEPLRSGQPSLTLERLASTTFAWIGEDPRRGTPSVRLERETEGVFVEVRRRSGRPVADQDFLLTHTPDPLIRERPSEARTHRWAVEWQAVVPWGTDALDAIEDRPGLPLGRYRLRVVGTGYELTSDSIEVVPGTIDVEATLAAGSLTVQARYRNEDGWRLLHPTRMSNEPLPVTGAVTLEIERGAATETMAATLDADGSAPVAVTGMVTAVTVVDRFGNRGRLEL